MEKKARDLERVELKRILTSLKKIQSRGNLEDKEKVSVKKAAKYLETAYNLIRYS